MEKKETLFVAFSTQKGGVGKTTLTVLAASCLHYVKGYNVAVLDCDYPQQSIADMRGRDVEQVMNDSHYKRMAHAQFTGLGKNAYTVENGCIVSKDADITAAFRVELPELFTVTSAEYEAVLHTDTRLFFQQSVVGPIVLATHGIRKALKLDKPFFGHAFSEGAKRSSAKAAAWDGWSKSRTVRENMCLSLLTSTN